MYAIIGITGNVGGATARALLKAGKKVRGIVRDKAKAAAWEAAGAELVVADMLDAAALETAMRGAEGIFTMIPADFAPEPGFPQARAQIATLRTAIDAARPPKVVYLSSVGAQHDRGLGLITQLHLLEEAMRPLPVANAFIRAAWFLENYLWDVAPARDRGEIDVYLDPADRAFPMIAVEDIGRLAAKTLQEEWQGNRTLELEGPERYSPQDAASAFARALNHEVGMKPISREKWVATFVQQGTPADRTALRVEMLDGFNSGWIDFERTGTESVKGSRTLEDVIRDLVQKEI